jgi:hypothetical protein
MQWTLRIKEMEHSVFVANVEPTPGMARILASTAMITLA